MSMLRISEAGTVQFPMVDHAAGIGWTPLDPMEALFLRGDESARMFRGTLEQKIRAFKPPSCDESITSWRPFLGQVHYGLSFPMRWNESTIKAIPKAVIS
jgi:hypothetical protein